MQVSATDSVLHPSEHHGDVCPGSAIRIETSNRVGFQQGLLAKQYKFSRPGIEDTPWGTREMTISDPFGNRLTFYERR